MDRAQADPISLQRNVILGLLLVLAAAAWAELVWQGAGGDMNMAMDSPTMGLRAPLFLAIWVIMMVAMMFPTAAPMIVTFHKVQAGKRQRGEAFVSTWIFVAAYLLVWGAVRRCRLCRRVRRRGDCRAHRAIADHRGPHRRDSARRGGPLPAHALEGLVPLEVPHAHHLHHDIVARRCCGRAAHGIAPRRLLPRLLLAPVRHPVPARHHEYRRYGGYHARHIRRENIALGSRGGSRRGGCTHSLWFDGRGRATTPADLLRGPRHGHACWMPMQMEMPKPR